MDELDGNDDPKAVQLVLSLSPQDVFILQLDGRKEWRLYDVPVKHPFMGHKVGRVPQGEPPAQAGRPRMTLTLEPGDMLYMPRGLVHEAATTDAAPSLHLTITADTQSASVAPFLGFMIHAATHEDRDRMSEAEGNEFGGVIERDVYVLTKKRDGEEYVGPAAMAGGPSFELPPFSTIFSDFFPFSPGLLAVLPGFPASRR